MELATNWLTELQPTGLLHKRESYRARVQGDMRPVCRGKQNIFTNPLKYGWQFWHDSAIWHEHNAKLAGLGHK